MFDDALFLTFADPEDSLQEQRFIIMEESAKGQLLVVAYTDCAGTTRLISARPPIVRNAKLMSQTFEMDDDLRPEYDFTQFPVIARGQGRKQSTLTVQLNPDVAAIFPDSAAVNEGLRLLIRLIQQTSSQAGVQSVPVSKEA